MHTSVVKLRPENILDVAKDVIRPGGWYCEWNTAGLQKPVMCRTPLNSWNAYLQHLIRHCQQSKASGSSLVCRLPRCNISSGLSISSYHELVNHIQQSHLSRSQLTCPIRDCPSISFSRPALLEKHFEEAHSHLIGQELSRASPLLLPTWRPFGPDIATAPAPLPGRPPPGSGLIPPVPGTPFNTAAAIAAAEQDPARIPVLLAQDSFPPPSSQLSQLSQLSPRKRPQLPRADAEEAPAPASSPTELEFADLSRRGSPDVDTAWAICARMPAVDLARPQGILDPERYGYRVPPGSILYDNFVRIHGLEGHGDEDEDEEDAEG